MPDNIFTSSLHQVLNLMTSVIIISKKIGEDSAKAWFWCHWNLQQKSHHQDGLILMLLIQWTSALNYPIWIHGVH